MTFDQDDNRPQNSQQVGYGIYALLKGYWKDLEGYMSGDLHARVMQTTEAALIRLVMKEMQGNQSKVAQSLGISRNTLRKKIIYYQLNTEE